MPTLEAIDTLCVTRQFKAPRERVFAAFSSLDGMSGWFGPPGCNLLGDSVDFREGGQYRLRIMTPDGEAVVAGTYREITTPSKLVFTWQWQDDEDWVDLESVITCEFQAVGDGTELTLTQIGFPSSESRGKHEHGWTGCLDKLDAYLAA